MEIQLNILGPLEVLAEGQREVAIAPQLQCVLVNLLMSPNVPVSVETLVDHLWDDNPPPKARATIRSYIWRVDRALSQVATSSVRLRRQPPGYALEVDPQAVDLHRFRSLRRQSDALADSGETRRAAVLLSRAEAIWRGPALAGLPGAWIGRMRDSLGEELRSATARRIGLELAFGRHAELLAELGQLSGRYPLDEVLSGHQMVALFRSGRQADALRIYRETRDRLMAEGIEPSPDLTRLHERILRHDPELAITPVYRRADKKPQPNTLPADIRDFTGRTEELGKLTGEAGPSGQPVQVIDGMAGVGKTALAIHAGHLMAARYPDAQLYLNFRAHDQVREPLDPADALRDLLMMLDVPGDRIPDSRHERAALWRAEIASRRALVIFDDVAHPEQVRTLLPEMADCLFIVTSRRRHPDWGAVRSMTLRVFLQDDAIALFTRIAGRAAGGERDDAAEAARLCAFLPLAIRLAASRLRTGATPRLPDLLEELHDPHAGPGHVNDLNHRLQATFELSYRQLTADEQRFFRHLGISPCTEVSARSGAAVSGVTVTAAEAMLGTLAGHHLLEEKSPGRFGFHDLIRAFAAGRFAAEDPKPEARFAVGRLADYYIGAIEQAARVIREHPAEAQPARAWLESEWGNALRVARYCSRHEWKRRCADLIHVLGDFLVAGGHWDDALAANLMALQACRDLDDLPGAGRAAFDLSLISLRTGRSEEALRHADDAATTFGRLGDQRGRAAALDHVGVIHRNTARFRDALAYHREAMEIYGEAGDTSGLAEALNHSAVALAELGRHVEAMDSFDEALRIYRRDGNLRGQAKTLNNIGVANYNRGYHKDAMRSWQDSLDIFHQIGGRQNLALLDHNMGQLHQYKGNYQAAVRLYRQVLATYRSIGDLQHQAHALADIGSVYQATDQFDEALAHYQEAAALGEAAGDQYVSVRVLCGIADAHFGGGRLGAALENYERAARLSGEIESPYLKGRALNGIAETVLRTQGPAAARIYWREAHDIFAQLGVPEAVTIEIRLHAIDTTAS